MINIKDSGFGVAPAGKRSRVRGRRKEYLAVMVTWLDELSNIGNPAQFNYQSRFFQGLTLGTFDKRLIVLNASARWHPPRPPGLYFVMLMLDEEQ